MRRSIKIKVILIFQIVVAVLAVILFYPLYFTPEKVVIIVLPIETLVFLLWQEIRSDSELIILKKLGFDEHVLPETLHLYKKHWFSPKITFSKHEYQKNKLELLEIHFDVGNIGKSATTCHEYRIWELYPENREIGVRPTFDTIRIISTDRQARLTEAIPSMQRITESANLLQRRLIPPGARFTFIYDLNVKYDYLVIRFELYSIKRITKKDYFFFFDKSKSRFFYAKCNLFRDLKFFKKKEKEITAFLSNIEETNHP